MNVKLIGKKKLKLDCWAVERAKVLKVLNKYHCSKNKLMFVLNHSCVAGNSQIIFC